MKRLACAHSESVELVGAQCGARDGGRGEALLSVPGRFFTRDANSHSEQRLIPFCEEH